MKRSCRVHTCVTASGDAQAMRSPLLPHMHRSSDAACAQSRAQPGQPAPPAPPRPRAPDTPRRRRGRNAAALAQAVSAAGSSPELVMTTFLDGVPLGEPTCRPRAGSPRGLKCRQMRGVGGRHGGRGSPSPPRTPRPGPPGLRQARTGPVSGAAWQAVRGAGQLGRCITPDEAGRVTLWCVSGKQQQHALHELDMTDNAFRVTPTRCDWEARLCRRRHACAAARGSATERPPRARCRLLTNKQAAQVAHRPSSQGVATVQMKNWLPLVSFPELAMDRMPGASCFRLKSSSCARARLPHLLGRAAATPMRFCSRAAAASSSSVERRALRAGSSRAGRARLELLAVDRLAASPHAVGEIAPLPQ